MGTWPAVPTAFMLEEYTPQIMAFTVSSKIQTSLSYFQSFGVTHVTSYLCQLNSIDDSKNGSEPSLELLYRQIYCNSHAAATHSHSSYVAAACAVQG